MPNLALGTVQFGLDYGITNHSGQVDLETVKLLLQQASCSGFIFLDTAQCYGSSHDVLGTALPKDMVCFYKEVMQKEADRICRVRVAMRKKIIATGSKHYDQETMNQRLLDAGWEGLKAAEIAYFFS